MIKSKTLNLCSFQEFPQNFCSCAFSDVEVVLFESHVVFPIFHCKLSMSKAELHEFSVQQLVTLGFQSWLDLLLLIVFLKVVGSVENASARDVEIPEAVGRVYEEGFNTVAQLLLDEHLIDNGEHFAVFDAGVVVHTVGDVLLNEVFVLQIFRYDLFKDEVCHLWL